jgi:hypothetical protein
VQNSGVSRGHFQQKVSAFFSTGRLSEKRSGELKASELSALVRVQHD